MRWTTPNPTRHQLSTDQERPIVDEAFTDLDRIAADFASRSLYLFLRKAWPIVEPDRPFIDNWHIHLMCNDLTALVHGTWKREIFNVPPGTMKSILISVIFPAWVWTRNKKARFLKASYSAHLSIRDNVKLRDLVESRWYSTFYGVKLVEDQNQKTQFNTQEKGWSLATSVGGAGTGEHPDYVIIDDPITAEQALSDVERERANQWFDQTVSTRGVILDVRCVVIMQRLHKEDLSGHLLARGGWKQFKLPMRYIPSRPASAQDPGHVAEPRDPRRQDGELLWPEAFTEEKVRKLELDLNPLGAAAQLQQEPQVGGGGLFKREWFKIVKASPVVARRVRGWDTASTEGGGCFSAGVRMAETKGQFYVEDVVRGQWGPAGLEATLKQVATSDGIGVAQREEREGGSAGTIVVASHVKLLVGFNYRGAIISKDKVTRAGPFRAQCEAGNVFLVEGPWNEEYIRELCDFPTGKFKDQVDGSSCAFNSVLLEPEPMTEVFAPESNPGTSRWNTGAGSAQDPTILGSDISDFGV
ncbi:MAG: phage terminase large subunit [Bryobacteraceae bacterium]